MPRTDPTPELILHYQQGNDQAANELFAGYAIRLMRVAEQHLSGKQAGEDAVLAVFHTFFRRMDQGEFRLDSSAQLWRLLIKFTLFKARAGALTPGREPTPDEAVALVDLIEQMLAGLPPMYVRVLALRLAGLPVAAIATEMNVSRQAVHHALDLLQGRLTQGM